MKSLSTWIVSALSLAGLLAGLLPQTAFSALLTERPAYAGVWVNGAGSGDNLSPYTNFIAGEADRLKWSEMEPTTEGVTDFSGLDTALTRARDRGYYYYFVLWTGPDAPSWIYSGTNNVPKVYTTDPPPTSGPYPYYLNANYKRCLTNFLDKLAGHLAGLSADKRSRLAFIQPGFGSTGDRQLYKGNPTNSLYNINGSNYLAFMQFATASMRNSFNARPETQVIQFLWNIDDYDGSDTNQLSGESDAKRGEMLYAEWIRSFGEGQFKKQQFTLAIGYMANDELDEDIVQRPSYYGYSTPSTPLRWNGNPEFVRGEHNDSKWAATPMATEARKWHYYWTAIQSVDRGLDAWETDWNSMTTSYNESYQFSTRHSFQKKAEKATQAFIALRDVLDYSDTSRFSETNYGTASKGNTTRINTILAQYAAYGATNENTAAVASLSGANYLLNSTGLNDCVWNVIGRNYQQHITQFDPNGTSVGWWRVGSTNQSYGRFARGFQHASGKDAMYFSFAADFPAKRAARVTFKIIYYDKTAGSKWAFKYDAGSSNLATALSITNIGDVTWKTASVTVTNPVLQNNGPNGSDFALVNTDAVDDIFHMIEVTYADVRYPLTVNSGSGSGLYTNGQPVAITASNLVGQTFVRWIGDTNYVNNVTNSTATVTMPANPVTLTATYTNSGLLPPTVSITSATGVTTNAAILHGNVDSNGGATILDQGFFYGNAPGITTNSTKVSAGISVVTGTNTYTTAGTTNWVCPAGVTSVTVECWGGGGAGGGASRNGQTGVSACGGGGAGGAYVRSNSFAVSAGTTYYINVGAGGVSSTNVDAAKVSGGDSWFNSVPSASTPLVAKGGGGGETVLLQSSASRFGAGGTVIAGSAGGDAVYTGGSGGTSTVAQTGGSGGGSGGTSSVGNAGNATNGVGAMAVAGGGNGGDANPALSGTVAGSAPTIPPGGGGGGARVSNTTTLAGGSGADGQVVLTYSSLVAGPLDFTLTNLSPNAAVYYRAYASNSAGLSLSAESNVFTLANVPAAPTVNGPTTTTLNVNLAGVANGNPASTQFAIQETNSLKYVQANGTLSASAVWQATNDWGVITVTGLSPGTNYALRVKARNGDNVETDFGPAAFQATAGPTRPVITSLWISGGNLIAAGTNSSGAAGGTYYLRASTNLLLPPSSWPRIFTNTYGPGGVFSVTNAMVPGVIRNLYRLE